MKTLSKLIGIIVILTTITSVSNAQGFDSTQIGKEYPYLLPILGNKAYTRGYKFQLPHGIMVNSIYNEQNILLENFKMAINDGDFIDLADNIIFGPSSADIKTFNFRADTWIFPFLSVGGYYGQYKGTTSVRLEGLKNSVGEPILEALFPIETFSDADGAYWGFNVLGIIPAGPVNLAVDYSWSWSQNELLNKPVRVDVSGIRVIKNFKVGKKPDMFLGVWTGAQFNKLGALTDGEIVLGDLGRSAGAVNQTALQEQWQELTTSNDWNQFSAGEQETIEALYNKARGIEDTVIKYQFNKSLEYKWNMLLGGNFQLNRHFQFRTEYGFLKSKKTLMFSANYRFGL
ncbi:hypothetical protein [Carboxylicivirga sp. M1479]|uniref:hypothetical protein n=1 Tax=Carboxylicivirga sp. M1479 TaxID=2594476 RepID=UPI0011776534|nr:hypothetical protein [Carboxylicivirga sp. M1479]TRX63295.1 hypothetical protein FNN09_18770 [Carboxylicivirga sp. M1479]